MAATLHSTGPPNSDDTSSPYCVGNVLELDFDGFNESISVEIIELLAPPTTSVVLGVMVPGTLIASNERSARAVLKVYDRRYADELRKYNEVKTWNRELELKFNEFVASGEATTFLTRLDDDDYKEPEEGWNNAENEAYLQVCCNDYYNDEKRAYQMLEPFQGKQIPRLFASGIMHRYPLEGPPLSSDKPPDDRLHIRGLLLEYIPGPTLENFTDSVPEEYWQRCVDKAVDVVKAYEDYGVINEDVKPRNVIVSSSSTGWQDARVVMLDFGHVEFRKPEHSDAEWGRLKNREDEEGAIGIVMRGKLRREHGFELQYVPSERWWEFAEGDEEWETWVGVRLLLQESHCLAGPPREST